VTRLCYVWENLSQLPAVFREDDIYVLNNIHVIYMYCIRLFGMLIFTVDSCSRFLASFAH